MLHKTTPFRGVFPRYYDNGVKNSYLAGFYRPIDRRQKEIICGTFHDVDDQRGFNDQYDVNQIVTACYVLGTRGGGGKCLSPSNQMAKLKKNKQRR